MRRLDVPRDWSRRMLWMATAIWASMSSTVLFGATFLVKEGQPQAEIVIAEQPPRMVRLAASELQTYIQKISGGKLPIVTAPTAGCPVQIYVGRSPHTDRLKETAKGLKHGAFQIKSGPSHLLLLGHDSDFTIPKFYLTTPSELPKLLKEWDAATGEQWAFASGNLYKEYHGELKIWHRDERGSLNAVYEYLRMLGVRWYLPAELGEIVPKNANLELPVINKTVRPDFPLRFPYQYGRMWGHEATTRDEVLWQLRMGWNIAPDVIGDFGMGLSHGMNPVYERPEVYQAHPEYFAIFGGKRTSTHGCLSSEGLLKQNVKYARTMFDLVDAPLVSLMPADGYTHTCECELCRGKSTLERGWDGQISDYVWSYVNRVASEVYKTHPDRKLNCYGYGTYILPPEKIETLSPNLIIGICQNRSTFQDPIEKKKFRDLRTAWLKKMPEGHKQLVINDYYLHGRPFTQPFMPNYYPHAIAEDLRALKGISIGDFIEVYRDPKGMGSLTFDHLNLHVTSRFWWDADQDIDKLLAEYYTEFYGPASGEMKAFIEYSETNLIGLGKNAEKIGKVLELLAVAQKKVSPESIYGQRIAYIADYMHPLHDLRVQLAKGRENVPEAVAFEREPTTVKIDGKLDEPFWQNLRVHSLRDLETGKDPYMGSSVRIAWMDSSFYFGIQCQERDTKHLKIGTTKKEDPAIWSGDVVEILLETQTHSYYQLALNPAGAFIDLDRKQGLLESLWYSGAQVATHVGDGFWTAEVRIPVVGEQQETIDRLNGVSGRKPSTSYPWYFNVCRQRVRPTETEYTAFAPAGVPSFHKVEKFGKLVIR